MVWLDQKSSRLMRFTALERQPRETETHQRLESDLVAKSSCSLTSIRNLSVLNSSVIMVVQLLDRLQLELLLLSMTRKQNQMAEFCRTFMPPSIKLLPCAHTLRSKATE